jgi:hypothetical protein
MSRGGIGRPLLVAYLFLATVFPVATATGFR